ncbi:MAG: RNA-binding domain-containing protein [Candidatus Methanofastidiosia archaeon]
MKKIVERIDIETFVHATESAEKVVQSLENLGVPKKLVEIEETKGHYGNDIGIARAKFILSAEKKMFLDSAFFKILEKDILENIEERIDKKGALYLRTDKQKLYEGSYVLHDRGDVKIVLKILSYPKKRDKVIENAKKLFGS